MLILFNKLLKNVYEVELGKDKYVDLKDWKRNYRIKINFSNIIIM